MTSRSLVMLLLLASCMQSHPDVQALNQTDCYTCHKPDYEATPTYAQSDPAVPDHIAQSYPTTCAQCHVTTTWQSHPETLFPIQAGAHAGVQCTDCHSGGDNASKANGADTKCATCHPSGENLAGGGTMSTGHSDLAAFSYTAPPAGFTTQNFCLSCHPSGVEAPHNDTIFPQSHKGAAKTCSDCHDRTKGSDSMGQNADCRRCHPNSKLMSVDDHPPNITTLPSPSGCLAMRCHYGGNGGN